MNDQVLDSAQAAYRADFVSTIGADYFSSAERGAVEQRCTLRGTKVYVRCLVRNKDVLAKPEEIVRQLWLERLTRNCGYPLNRLVVEFPVTFGRDSSKRADIVILDAEQDGAVASSGFLVLQPRAVAAEVLMTYLRLPLVCEVMDLHTSASLYPAISESDLLSLPFPAIGQAESETIAKCVQEAHASRRRARELLSAAQRAVEIAIEQGEAAALAYLDDFNTAP